MKDLETSIQDLMQDLGRRAKGAAAELAFAKPETKRAAFLDAARFYQLSQA